MGGTGIRMGGTGGGALLGGIIGSMFPVVGTALGAAIGGAIGGGTSTAATGGNVPQSLLGAGIGAGTGYAGGTGAEALLAPSVVPPPVPLSVPAPVEPGTLGTFANPVVQGPAFPSGATLGSPFQGPAAPTGATLPPALEARLAAEAPNALMAGGSITAGPQSAAGGTGGSFIKSANELAFPVMAGTTLAATGAQLLRPLPSPGGVGNLSIPSRPGGFQPMAPAQQQQLAQLIAQRRQRPLGTFVG